MATRKIVTLGVSLFALAVTARAQTNPSGGVWTKARTEPASLLTQASSAGAQAKSAPGFQGLRVLVGEWEGKSHNGMVIHVSYQMTSGGTALVETLRPMGEPDMTTVYSADGSHVAVTHFCSANNQPRMRTAALSKPTKEYVFTYMGATNLATPDAAHMQGLVLLLDDNDHLTQKWTWRENGKDTTEVFQYERKK